MIASKVIDVVRFCCFKHILFSLLRWILVLLFKWGHSLPWNKSQHLFLLQSITLSIYIHYIRPFTAKRSFKSFQTILNQNFSRIVTCSKMRKLDEKEEMKRKKIMQNCNVSIRLSGFTKIIKPISYLVNLELAN